MSPQERHNIVAKSIGAPTVEVPKSAGQFHTNHNITTFANEQRNAARAAAKAAPPAKAVQTPDPNAVANFDKEMRAAGKQLPAEADEQAFRVAAVKWLEDWCNQQPDDWQREHEPQMQKWAAEVEAGRASVQYNEASGKVELHSRTAPAAAPARNPNGTFASDAATNAALDKATRASNKYGFAPASAITGPLLFGYTLPPNREYNVAELVAGLRLARGGDLTQQQVNQIIARSNA